MRALLVTVLLVLAAVPAHAAEKGPRVKIAGGRQFLEGLLLGPQARVPGLTLGGQRLRLREVPQLHAPEAPSPSRRAPAGRGPGRARPTVSPFSGEMPAMRQPASIVPLTTPALRPPGGPL